MKKLSRILFLGDTFVSENKIFNNKYIEDVDGLLCIANLESPVLKDDNFKIAKKVGKNLFQTPLLLSKLMDNFPNKVYVGANNHIYDYGKQGIFQTIKYLSSKKIPHAGFGLNIKDASKHIMLNKDIALIAVGEDEFGVATDNKSGYWSAYGDDVLKKIKKLKTKGLVVFVSFHGGGEEVPLPSKYMMFRSRMMIDAGADLIIGHHPHVPQGWEIYKGKYIFYSLGNFVHDSFKKYWGIAVAVEINKNIVKKIDIKSVNVNKNFVKIDKLKSDKKDYLNSINKIISNPEMFESICRIQSSDMLNRYYSNYINRIVGVKNRIFKKAILGEKERQGWEELLFLNLIQNKSHQEFIKTALNIKYFDNIKPNPRDVKLYKKLRKYIVKNFV